jgi:hypothetical protein
LPPGCDSKEHIIPVGSAGQSFRKYLLPWI